MHECAKKILIQAIAGILFFQVFATYVFGATVQATVDATRISIGESLHLKVSTDESGALVDTSPIADFKVMPQGESTSIQIINSKYSKEVSQTFLLFPLKTGRLTIPALPVTQDGKKAYTQPITIVVTEKPVGQSGTSDIFVRAVISNENPYVGEQFLYVFQLFQGINIANARLQEPSFNGFFSKKIGDETTRQKVINGRNFTITEVRYVLIADTPGNHVIEPAVLTGSIPRAGRTNNRGFPFDSFFNNRQLEARQYRTESINFTVRPLPSLTDPAQSYSGLVGSFSMSGTLSSAQVKTGDSTTLSIVVEGEGNLIDLSRLDISVPDQWKVYDDKPVEEIKTGSKGFYGKKNFHYALVPVNAGDFRIPPVQLVYFDITENAYKTISSSAFNVSVAKSAVAQQTLSDENISSGSAKPILQKKHSVKMTGHDILPVTDDLSALDNQEPMGFFYYLFGIFTPPAVFLLISYLMMGFQARKKPEKMLRKNAKQIFNDISAGRLKDDEIPSSLSQALCYAVRYNSGCTNVSITSSEVRHLLKSTGCSDLLIQDTSDILEELESITYSGLKIEKSRQSDLVSKSSKVIQRLCK